MGDRSEPFDRKTNFAERCDNTNFIPKQYFRSIEGLTMQNSLAQTPSNYYENNICRSKSDSALWRKDDERPSLDQSRKDSINLTINSGTGKAIANIPVTKLRGCHRLFDNEGCLLHNDKSLHGFLSKYTSLSLPALLSISSMNASFMKDEFKKSDNDIYTYRDTAACFDEEETVFNQWPSRTKDLRSDLQCSANENSMTVCKVESSESEHDKSDVEEHTVASNASKIEQPCRGTVDSQLQASNIEVSDEKTQNCEDPRKKNNFSPAPTAHVRSNLTTRPTLADDSKLVKMSLLANPMNIMPSNVQLFNRSRNFLNFITEKSTNIMEKALLPQHLAMRYNHVSKSIVTDTTAAAFCITDEPPVGDTRCKSYTDLTTTRTNSDDALKVKRDRDKSEEDKLDGAMNDGSKIDPFAFVRKNKTYDLEDETVSDEMMHHILDKDDRLECDTTDRQRARRDFLSAETDESKIDTSQVGRSHDDKTHRTESFDVRSTLLDSDTSKYGSLEHPLHRMLLADYAGLKVEYSKLREKAEGLEKSDRLNGKARTNADAYNSQVRNLEKAVIKLTTDLNASLAAQEALKNECTAVNKEKENMVMKYVISEKQLIDSQRATDTAERKVKELVKDQEALQYKLRQTQGERTRICSILDTRRREIADHQKEIEKLKEEARMKEIQFKWALNKLKTETDSQKDTQQKLDKALMKINDMKEECEQIRRETQESFRKFQQSEENKAVTLDQQLKEHQARLILERHVTEDKETLRLQLQKKLEVLKSRQQDLIEENKRLNIKVQESEKVQLNYENSLSDLKIVMKQRKEQITDLSNKVSHLETLKLQLQHKEDYIATTEVEMQQLRSANEELQSDMHACRQKEADMLDFTQKLTDKNVRLQSEFIAIQRKADYLESEHGPLRDRISELTSKVKALERDLTEEQRKRKEECELLAKHVAEQTQLAQNIVQKFEDSQGENAVLKRKHQTSIKEMTRELQQCRRKLEMFEAASPSNSLDITSRTGSNTSLNTGDTLNGALSDNNANGDHVHSVEPNRQVLMDHIIKLQEINAKRAEKIDFLEGHIQELLEEVQKKKKIIQNYILHQNSGALGCNERDRHKAELARHGGIMASVYNHRVSDENMTLDLSLEINQKLQAVLEDVLLKNITLKDNIDTLGKEIARLTMQYQQRQIEN
ncbi:PREDICTED: coiled-coil domain-containing protein 186 isoform X2 [Dinoponera quadriceps]|uniref:Coiled-coil domain-containing protein 186 isoform X2 n=1 Tax=Dinoponera quadriceps TaxID=609295 RepID=A0A6P3XK79_DINQU|nr:PREDICTED: coiled-coil domain-containing protein 186 isoform X2 [Dinoponera quadriceps]